MKKIVTLLLVLIGTVCLSFFSVACNKEVEVKSVSVDGQTVLVVGQTETLNAVVDASGDVSVNWSSDNPSAVTVDDRGNVTATGEGSAVITAKAGDKSDSHSISTVTLKDALENMPKLENFTEISTRVNYDEKGVGTEAIKIEIMNDNVKKIGYYKEIVAEEVDAYEINLIENNQAKFYRLFPDNRGCTYTVESVDQFKYFIDSFLEVLVQKEYYKVLTFDTNKNNFSWYDEKHDETIEIKFDNGNINQIKISDNDDQKSVAIYEFKDIGKTSVPEFSEEIVNMMKGAIEAEY